MLRVSNCPLRAHRSRCKVLQNYMFYSTHPIFRGVFYLHNWWKTPIARPFGRGMVVFSEFFAVPKFYLRIYRAVSSIVLYYTTIYRVHCTLINVSIQQAELTRIRSMALIILNIYYRLKHILRRIWHDLRGKTVWKHQIVQYLFYGTQLPPLGLSRQDSRSLRWNAVWCQRSWMTNRRLMCQPTCRDI